MSTQHFETTAHAKWILTGEHSVLRGRDAIVYPLLNCGLTLRYTKDAQACRIVMDKRKDKTLFQLKSLLEDTFAYGLKLLGRPKHACVGGVAFDNTIPIGSGLGFSAALCVVLARLFVWKGWLDEDQIFTLSNQLEHFLHGTSSGVDIVGVCASVPMYYRKGETPRPLNLIWNPTLCLSLPSSSRKSLTAHCITKVARASKNDPKLAAAIDDAMYHSTKLAFRSLTQEVDPEKRLQQLACAIGKASWCFHQWGLIPKEVAEHMLLLKQHGALAVKPTGAGGGGHVVSLWKNSDTVGPQKLEIFAVDF